MAFAWIPRTGDLAVSRTVVLALIIWVGFPVVLLTGSVTWEKVHPATAAIHAGNWLVKLVLIALIKPAPLTTNLRIADRGSRARDRARWIHPDRSLADTTKGRQPMNSTSATKAGPLDHTFTATLVQSPAKGGWTYVVMDGSAEFFATRGLVKVTGTIDDQPFTSSFMALGDGTHKLPVNATIRGRLGKQSGDTVTVHLDQRLK